MKTLLITLALIGSVFAGPLEDYNNGIAKLKDQYEKAVASGFDKEKAAEIFERERTKLQKELENATEQKNIIIRRVEIDAKTDGKRIGSFLEGEEITIEYVSGEWVAYKDWKTESPDTATISQHRIALVHRAIDGTETVITHPKSTEGNPLRIKIEKKGNYVLRIADPVLDANYGKVIYKVGVVK